jgi:hypothetical protein
MRLCMFHPIDQPMERGWVGRVDGEHVVHLAAQTLQSFFLGGGGAREHAEYRLDDVVLLAPVLQPPAVRVFDGPTSFAFANPTSVVGPGAQIGAPTGRLAVRARLAAVVGAEGTIGGFTTYAEWRAPELVPPKDTDFAASLGPVVVTADELGDSRELRVTVGETEPLVDSLPVFEWEAARSFAGAGTTLRPGDLLVGPCAGEVDAIPDGSAVGIEIIGIGALSATTGHR